MPVLMGLFASSACSSADAEKAPAGVLSRFLDAMDRSTVSEAALADAYALLDDGCKRQLRTRAEQATSVAGRELEPWQMLAQGRFRLRFAPADHGGMHASINGDSAVVRVVSDDRSAHADVPMVRENGRWHVKLAIPELRRAEPEAPVAAP